VRRLRTGGQRLGNKGGRLDNNDMELLILLQQDSSRRAEDYCKTLGISKRQFGSKKRKLRDLEIISGYVAKVNMDRIFEMDHSPNKNWNFQNTFPYLTLTEMILEDIEKQTGIEQHLSQMNHVVGWWRVSGATYDYIIQFISSDARAYYAMIQELRQQFRVRFRTMNLFGPQPLKNLDVFPISVLKLPSPAAAQQPLTLQDKRSRPARKAKESAKSAQKV